MKGGHQRLGSSDEAMADELGPPPPTAVPSLRPLASLRVNRGAEGAYVTHLDADASVPSSSGLRLVVGLGRRGVRVLTALGGSDAGVLAWDAHEGAVGAVCFVGAATRRERGGGLPSLVATAGDDGVVRLWDAARVHPAAGPAFEGRFAGEPRTGAGKALSAVAVGGDGDGLVAAGGAAGHVAIWDRRRAGAIPAAELQPHADAVTHLAFLPAPAGGGARTAAAGAAPLASWSVDGQVCVSATERAVAAAAGSPAGDGGDDPERSFVACWSVGDAIVAGGMGGAGGEDDVALWAATGTERVASWRRVVTAASKARGVPLGWRASTPQSQQHRNHRRLIPLQVG